MRSRIILAALIIFMFALAAQADVRHESVIEYKFSGALGTVMKVFGMGKPIKTVEYYSDNVMRSDELDKKGKVRNSEIIDLEKELFISIDHKKKRYTQMTFDEWRQQLEEMMANYEEMQAEQEEEEYEEEGGREYTYEMDIQVADETEEVNGFEARKMTMTIDVYSKEKGSDEEPVKEMTIISDHWLTPELEGNQMIQDFNRRLAEKLGMNPEEGQMASMFQQIAQSSPELVDAMQKMEAEGEGLDGVPVKTVTVFKSVKTPEDESEQEEEESGGGGLFGGIKKKAAKKVIGGGDDEPDVLLELHSNIMDHSTEELEATTFTVPEKYKLRD
ncbi:MAG: hypothetical protein GF310_11895 [candidate division Zixibacteria bacterium]|nr:hypothetical protein [candidate division Zixibacteria bacterium]